MSVENLADLSCPTTAINNDVEWPMHVVCSRTSEADSFKPECLAIQILSSLLRQAVQFRSVVFVSVCLEADRMFELPNGCEKIFKISEGVFERKRAKAEKFYLLPHLHSGWAVDQAILAEEERLMVIRLGHNWDDMCMQMDKVLSCVAESKRNFEVIYLVDITEVPNFNTMYELCDPSTVMLFFYNKHIMIDLGSIRVQNRPLSEKMKVGEIVEEACLRSIFEELGPIEEEPFILKMAGLCKDCKP